MVATCPWRLAFYFCGHYLAGVPPKKITRQRLAAAKLRSRSEYLGSVEAPDRERAKAAAIKHFDLDQDQRGRLLILERP
jgi:hypothetical protein